MAVGAEQDALRRLCTHASDALRQTAVRETEQLGLRIQVMELKRCRMLVKTTKETPAACLLDKDALNESPSLRYGFGGALGASRPRIGPHVELDRAMLLTAVLHPRSFAGVADRTLR